ncbi:MAG: pyridoxal 5'-phosphate synthase glutaminase subunit PdxT [Candidatus Gracilibacteria bacterium]|jgi:5'-phosphate synthase pdxT subunit
MKIGVLDIQGSIEEHFSALKRARIDAILVKNKEDLREISGLIIPGGESTVISKLLKKFGLFEKILKSAKNGLRIWGTCAGAILLAKKIGNDGGVFGLNLMNIEVERNAYGRQLDSFETKIDFKVDGVGRSVKKIDAIFIRAPKIVKVGKECEVLAKYKDEIVAVREGNFLATTFHPELTGDLSVHKYFEKMCE